MQNAHTKRGQRLPQGNSLAYLHIQCMMHPIFSFFTFSVSWFYDFLFIYQIFFMDTILMMSIFTIVIAFVDPKETHRAVMDLMK